MSESLTNRAAVIRDYLRKVEPPIAPLLIYRYSATAARWEAVRLLIDRRLATPADDRRFADLSNVLRTLTKKLRLDTCTEEKKGADGIPGLTWAGGWLPYDPQRIICTTWQEGAR
jgi:hypothetical protein